MDGKCGLGFATKNDADVPWCGIMGYGWMDDPSKDDKGDCDDVRVPAVHQGGIRVCSQRTYPVPYKCNTKVDEGYCKKIADGFQYAYNILFRENKYDENASGVCVIDHDNKVVKFTDNAVGTTNDLICGGENT